MLLHGTQLVMKYVLNFLHCILARYHYLSINSVKTNGPTLCPFVWLPYAPESVERPLVCCIDSNFHWLWN